MNYVTGSTGFIGSKLMSKIPASGVSHHRFRSFGIRARQGDTIYHLSSYGNLFHHHECSQIIRANLLDLMLLNHSPAKVIFVSTSSVALPVQTVYSAMKRAAELWLSELSEIQDYVIVRPFSVTGVGEHRCHLIPTMIRCCLSGEHADFSGSPVHDYVDVDDAAEGLVCASRMPSGSVVEIGSGIETSNQEVLRMVEEECGSTASITRVDRVRPYDTGMWKSDPEMWPRGWRPKKKLGESVREMVKLYAETNGCKVNA